MRHHSFLIAALISLILAFLVGTAQAYDLTLAWDPYPQISDLAGVRVYSNGEEVGTIPVEAVYAGSYTTSGWPWKDGSQEIYAMAFDAAGNESGPSDIIIYDPAPPTLQGFKISIQVNVTVE